MTEYVMVPVEPTREMIEASGYDYCAENIDAYKAMLSAAPQQAAEPVGHAFTLLRGREDSKGGAYFSTEDYIAMSKMPHGAKLYAGQPPAQPHPWAPNRFEYDRSIHSCPDAKAWADLFVQTFPGLADKHDLMVTWFANAMMAMHDHLQRRPAQPEQPAPIPTSERLPTGADADHDGLVLAFTKFTKEWVLQSRLHVHDNPGAYTHWQPTGLTRPAAPDSGGCAVTAIDELNRQRAERHRLVDADFDALIKMVQDQCKHEEGERLESMLDGMVSSIRKTGKCKHCGAPMPEPLSNT